MAAPAAPPQQPMYSVPPVYANPYMPRPRVQAHLQTLGILWCVYAGYRVVKALAGYFLVKAFAMHSFGGFGWPFAQRYGGEGPTWLAALLPFIAASVAVTIALAIVVGWSLLNRKPWGRTLGVIAAILALLSPVLGTALGIYTLWVLAPAVSGMEYEAIADRS